MELAAGILLFATGFIAGRFYDRHRRDANFMREAKSAYAKTSN